jgi:uncharacterized membrane protein YoaK (UPF0700 family)
MGASLLSAVAGYVDTAGFLALFGLFTAHVTGGLVTAGTAVTRRWSLGAGSRVAMVPVFMLTVAVTTLVARAIRRRGGAPLTALLGLMTGALAIFCVTGAVLQPLAQDPDAWAVVLIGGTGVVAMGIQNTLMRDALRNLGPTTLMTGNLTQFTIDLVEIALPPPASTRQKRRQLRIDALRRLRRCGLPLGGFLVGGVLGAWLTGVFGLCSIALPTLVTGVMAAMASAHERG